MYSNDRWWNKKTKTKKKTISTILIWKEAKKKRRWREEDLRVEGESLYDDIRGCVKKNNDKENRTMSIWDVGV